MFRPYQGFNRFLLRSGYLIQMHKRPGWSHLDLSLQRCLCGTPSIPRWINVRLEANVRIWKLALDVDQDSVAVFLLSRKTFPERLRIRPIHFMKGTRHESATIPTIQLEFEGKYNKSFETHIEIMGNYCTLSCFLPMNSSSTAIKHYILSTGFEAMSYS
ncbi:hypothetical protein BJV74DRAFT_858114 [Russula compacta]|nr:hypothetical protein BJV74DRAFT_858114 [Russula compacta]